LPWNLPGYVGWKTSFKIYISLGVLKEDDETDLLTTISQNIVFTGIDGRVSIDLGGVFALLSYDKIGPHDFGGLLQFNYNSGISYNRFFKNSIIGYRFFHISDRGIYNGKRLNRHMLELSYPF